MAARNYPAIVLAGVIGLVLVILGTFVLPHPASLLALGVGGPLSGLSFWARRTDSDDDDPPGDDDDPEPPPPGGDWERIVEQLERDVKRHDLPETPGGDRKPARKQPATPALV